MGGRAKVQRDITGFRIRNKGSEGTVQDYFMGRKKREVGGKIQSSDAVFRSNITNVEGGNHTWPGGRKG